MTGLQIKGPAQDGTGRDILQLHSAVLVRGVCCTCAHDVVLGCRFLPAGHPATAGPAAAPPPSLVTGLPRILPFRDGLGLHDICQPALVPQVSQNRAFAVSYSSRRSGSPDYLVITWDREADATGGDAYAVYRDHRSPACRS